MTTTVNAFLATDTPRFKVEGEHIEVLSLEQARSLMEYVAEFRKANWLATSRSLYLRESGPVESFRS